METVCDSFNQAVCTVLARPSTVIATIAERGNPFIEGIKLRPDVLLFTVTRENRASITDERLRAVGRFTPDGKPAGASSGRP